MRIRLTRFTAAVLWILLLPIVLPLRIVRRLTGRGKTLTYESTLEGDPLAYSGQRPVVIAVWASWATVWKVATAAIIQQVKTDFAGKCEFVYIEYSNAVQQTYGLATAPTIIVLHRGKEVARYGNLLEADKLVATLRSLTEASPQG